MNGLPFQLTVGPDQGANGAVRVGASGELDSASGQQLLDGFAQATASPERPQVILDLSQLGFIDSAGMRALIAVEQEASSRGIPLTVISPPEPVTRLLEIAGVAERVKLVSEGEAPPRETDFLERVELELAADERAPLRARAAVRDSMRDVLAEAELATLVLMTSELVTNAVVHSGAAQTAAVGLRTVRFPDAVRVEVDDPGAGFDPLNATLAEGEIPGPEEGGRGLFVVDRCASRWGIRRAETDRGHRFSVWFELAVE